jgi:hypothetical protein
MDVSCSELISRHAATAVPVGQKVEKVKLRIDLDAFVQGLAIEGVQDNPAGPVRSMAGPFDRLLSKLRSVPSERALGDRALAGAIKGHAHVFQLVNRTKGILGQHLGCILVGEKVSALDGVIHVPFPRIRLLVPQRRGNAALGRARMRPCGIHLADEGHIRMVRRFHCGPEPCQACPDNDDVMVKFHGRYSNIPIEAQPTRENNPFRYVVNITPALPWPPLYSNLS